MLVRRAALTIGVLLVIGVSSIATVAPHAFEPDAPQLAGTIASHLGMLLALWGIAPALRRALTRLDEMHESTLRAGLSFAVVVPFAVVVALLIVAPHTTHHLLTREWGIVEPLQVALYVCAVWLCLTIAGRLSPDDAARGLYKAGAIVALVLILEEVDYLGLLAVAIQLMGGRGGRLGRKHIGGFHDVVDAGTQMLGLVAIAAAAVVVLIVLWTLLGRYRTALVREATRAGAAPIAFFVLAMLTAQLTDIDDLLLPRFLAIRGVEEALELLAALSLDAGLILRLRETSGDSQ